MSVELRECRCCHEEFPATGEYFYNKAASPDGLHPNCIPCCKVNRSLEAVRKRDKEVKLSIRQLVRAKSLGVAYEEVELVEVYRKDRGICQIATCKKWVMPKHASMDHRLPLSKGGTHLYANVQLTHFKCNLRKSNKIL
jgi:5-methylcytosine-specific restriction endonuclease McrA